MRSILSTLLLSIILFGCSSEEKNIWPTANNILDALRQEDKSVIQVKLHQCTKENMIGEKDAPIRFYDFNCQMTIERFDSIRNKSFLKKQRGTLNLSGGSWTITLDYMG